MTASAPTFARPRIIRPVVARAGTSPAQALIGCALAGIMAGALVWALNQPLSPVQAPVQPDPAPIAASAPAPSPVIAPPAPALDDQPTAFEIQQAENARELNAELRGGMPMHYATGDIDQDISDLVDSRIDAVN